MYVITLSIGCSEGKSLRRVKCVWRTWLNYSVTTPSVTRSTNLVDETNLCVTYGCADRVLTNININGWIFLPLGVGVKEYTKVWLHPPFDRTAWLAILFLGIYLLATVLWKKKCLGNSYNAGKYNYDRHYSLYRLKYKVWEKKNHPIHSLLCQCNSPGFVNEGKKLKIFFSLSKRLKYKTFQPLLPISTNSQMSLDDVLDYKKVGILYVCVCVCVGQRGINTKGKKKQHFSGETERLNLSD